MKYYVKEHWLESTKYNSCHFNLPLNERKIKRNSSMYIYIHAFRMKDKCAWDWILARSYGTFKHLQTSQKQCGLAASLRNFVYLLLVGTVGLRNYLPSIFLYGFASLIATLHAGQYVLFFNHCSKQKVQKTWLFEQIAGSFTCRRSINQWLFSFLKNNV